MVITCLQHPRLLTRRRLDNQTNGTPFAEDVDDVAGDVPTKILLQKSKNSHLHSIARPW